MRHRQRYVINIGVRTTTTTATPTGLLFGCAGQEERAEKAVSACWSSWLALAEGEALDFCDVHGQQRAAFVGRGQELRF